MCTSGASLGGAEPQVVVLVRSAASSPAPGVIASSPPATRSQTILPVGAAARREQPVRRGVDRSDVERLVLDHRLAHGEPRRRLHPGQLLDLRDHVLVERALRAEDQHVGRGQRFGAPAGRVDGVLRVGHGHPLALSLAVGLPLAGVVDGAAASGSSPPPPHPATTDQHGPGRDQAQPSKPSHPVRVGRVAASWAGHDRIVADRHPRRRLISALIAGTTSCRSPITAYVALVTIGASASVLMARMFLALEQPAQCWMAPLIPHGM